jgi:hypothetical protein
VESILQLPKLRQPILQRQTNQFLESLFVHIKLNGKISDDQGELHNEKNEKCKHS